MKKLLSLFILGIFIYLAIPFKSSHSQMSPVPYFTIPIFVCGPFDKVKKDLIEEHGEKEIFRRGFTGGDTEFIYFENMKEKTWTLGIKGPKNNFCLVFISDLKYTDGKQDKKGFPIKYVP